MIMMNKKELQEDRKKLIPKQVVANELIALANKILSGEVEATNIEVGFGDSIFIHDVEPKILKVTYRNIYD